MKLVIKEQGKYRINKIIQWLFYTACYTIVFIFVTSFFDSVYVEPNHLIICSFVIETILYFLNITIKPVLVRLTIPITGLTLGLFYPLVNLFILKIVDWILGSYFELNNFWISLLVACLLSISNIIVEEIIIKPIIKGVQKNG